MVAEIKDIMDKLNSALGDLARKVGKVEETQASLDNENKKLEDRKAEIETLSEGLNERELNVAHIESIDKFSAEAKSEMAAAKLLKKTTEENKSNLDAGIKQLAVDRKAFDKEMSESKILEKKQSDAVRKIKAKLDDDIKAFAVQKKVEKEMSK